MSVQLLEKDPALDKYHPVKDTVNLVKRCGDVLVILVAAGNNRSIFLLNMHAFTLSLNSACESPTFVYECLNHDQNWGCCVLILTVYPLRFCRCCVRDRLESSGQKFRPS